MIEGNEGPADRAMRLVAGIVLLPGGLIVLQGLQDNIVGLVVAALGLVVLATGSAGRWVILSRSHGGALQRPRPPTDGRKPHDIDGSKEELR